MAKAHKRTITDGIGIVKGEGVVGEHDPESIFDPTEVKGPDPKVWGDDEDRPVNAMTFTMPTHPFDDEGEPMEVKGPDPEVWGGEEVPPAKPKKKGAARGR